MEKLIIDPGFKVMIMVLAVKDPFQVDLIIIHFKLEFLTFISTIFLTDSNNQLLKYKSELFEQWNKSDKSCLFKGFLRVFLKNQSDKQTKIGKIQDS